VRKGLAAILVVVAIGIAYRWWASDERAIRRQLSAIAEAMSVPPNEGSLGPVTRVATLRRTLAPDVRVSATSPGAPATASGEPAQQLDGRDVVLGAVGRWMPPRGGIMIDFTDEQVTVASAGIADVRCTVRLVGRDDAAEPRVDERRLEMRFTKIDGAWLVQAVVIE
jgi:hypothetical protein